MSDAPERIWIEDEFGDGDDDQWTYGTWDVRNYAGYDVEYVRADLALPAVQPDAGWHPIETIPDREAVLLSDGVREGVGQSCDMEVIGGGKIVFDWGWATRPTHWMRLPKRPAVQPGKEVMPDVEDTQHARPDAAPASTADAGGGATREEVAEALWRADQYQGQIRLSFADLESHHRNHWLMMADVAIETIKGEKK